MPDRDDLSGRTVGEFVVHERIGSGGSGDVYRCEQPLLGRQAVVKVLHPRLRYNEVMLQRFMREAQLASRLDHPYAAHVYAFGIERDDGLFWIAMEMVQGTTLTRWLKERGPLALDRLVPFFELVAEVVQTAHDRGIVHRDLKPSNVMMIERAGRLLPKLLDFGIAKLLDEAAAELPLAPGTSRSSAPAGNAVPEAANRSGHTMTGPPVVTHPAAPTPFSESGHPRRLTRAGAMLGSPPYMSPEQWSNAVTVGPSADLYALGVVAYEALTGRRPFDAPTLAEYAELHCNAAVPPLGDGFSPALDPMFQRALAKRPDDRWGNALELAAAFRAASGLGHSTVDLPRLDEDVRDTWVADAPQPLAESVAALDGARNAHQARDAALQLTRHLVRYLLALAFATHSQVHDERSDPELIELVRAMRHRDVRDDERVRLLRLLVRPLASRRGAHPIPELVDLVTPRAEDGADGLDALLALYATSDHAGTDDAVRARLARLIPVLTDLLHNAMFVLDHVLVVPRAGKAERWTGLRRPHRALATVRAGELIEHHPMLVDRKARICVDLWPLVQAVSPSEGAEPELFLFDGRGRHGALLIATPSGFEHHDPAVWDWIAGHIIGEIAAAPEVDLDDHAPYLGLAPFSTSDADRFVGREREVEALLNRLRQRPLQIVVGASGAGKSSFVHAGALAGLPAGWRAITLRPGSTPISALASRLAAANIATADLQHLLEAAPAAVAALVAQASADGTTVIVIDQLEELFTLCTNATERQQFAAVIAQLAASVEAPIRVICTIRDDFLMQLEALEPLRQLLSPALVLLGNPSRDIMVRILVEPAQRAGYALSDPELAQDIVDAVPDRPGALALLSFTASRLWELRDRRFRQLTRSAYDAMEGVGGALGQHAEATFEALTPDEQRRVREIFRHLVTAENTRAQLTSSELRQRLATPRADAVIDKLVAARLLAVSDSDGDSRVEIIHEALIGAWPRLQQWAREDADGARMRELLRVAARQWGERGRPSGMLWRGDALLDYTRWRARNTGPLTDLETAFGRASVEASARGRRVRRGILAAAIAVLAIGIIVLLSINASKEAALRRAEDSDRLSREQVIALDQEYGRQRFLAGDPIRAAIYLDAAVRAGGHGEALHYLLARATAILDKQQLSLVGHTAPVRDGRYSHDGATIVTAGEDRTARIWSATTGKLIATLSGHAGRRIFSVDIDRAGARVVTGSDDKTARIWDVRTGRSMAVLSGHDHWIWAVRFSPDGTRVVTASADATARLWDAATGQLIASLQGAGPQILDAVFSGRDLYLLSETPKVTRWDATTGQARGSIAVHAAVVGAIAVDRNARVASASLDGSIQVHGATGERVATVETQLRVRHMAFSSDGARLAVAGRDEVQVWDVERGLRLASMRGHTGDVTSIEFTPDATRIASSSEDGTVRLWDAVTGQPLALIPSLEGIRWVSFSPDGRRIAVGGGGGASVWDTRNDARRAALDLGQLASWVALRADGGEVVACGRAGAVRAWSTGDGSPAAAIRSTGSVRCVVAITPDGSVVITGDDDGKVQTWDAKTGEALHTLAPAAGATYAISVSPEGRRVATGHNNGDVRIWDVATGRLLVALTGHTAQIFTITWSPGGDRVATCSNDATATIWDATTGTRIRTLTVDGPCASVAFDLAGDRVATASRQIARVWNRDGALAGSYEGHQGLVTSVTFGTPGLLITAGDSTVRIWDLATQQPLEVLSHPEPTGVLDAHVSLDRSVVAARSGSRVYLWELQPRVSLARARTIIDALPLILQEGALVRKPLPLASPVGTR